MPRAPRFELDRAWLWRGFLVLAIVGFVLVFAKASMLLFTRDNNRLERQERGIEQPAVTQPVMPSEPVAPR